MDIEELRKNWERQFVREEIDRLREALQGYGERRSIEIESEISELKNAEHSSDHEQRMASLDDDRSFLPELIKLGDELAILALYKKVEITRTRLLQNEIEEAKRIDLSNAREIESRLRLDLSEIDGAYGVDELRHLSNAIKHNGVVTKGLASCGGWKVGEKLKDLGVEYESLAVEAEKYIRALVDAIEAHKKKYEMAKATS